MRNAWKFFAVLPKADRALALAWWIVLVLRGVLPAVLRRRDGRARRRGAARRQPRRPARRRRRVFVLLQVLTPIHQAISANLGDRTAAWLYDRLTEACVRPPGMGHLEDPTLTSDLTVARDFDLGMTGPPLSISMDFIAGGHGRDDRRARRGGRCSSRTPGGRRSCSAAPGWPRTGCCARALSGAIATPTRCAARSATPTTPTGWPSIRAPAKELRLFGLADWTHRALRRPADACCTRCSTRRRGCARSRCSGACCSSPRANVVVFWSLASDARGGPPHPRRGRRLRAGGDRHVDDRVRRAQLGARRRGGAGGGRAAARSGDGGGRRAAVGPAAGRGACRRARSASAT